MKPRTATPRFDCSITLEDWAAFMERMLPGTIDLIITDPPYNISKGKTKNSSGEKRRFTNSMEYGKWDQDNIDIDQFTAMMHQALRPGGAAVIFYDPWKITEMANRLWDADLTSFRLLEWVKPNPKPYGCGDMYLTNVREMAIYCKKRGGDAIFNGYFDDGRYRHAKVGKKYRYHPTQKPIELIRAIINKHTRPGDLVIDPFLGSGTSAVASVLDGRRFAGCDIQDIYIKTAIKRVADARLNPDHVTGETK